jgi:hypothetical protein
LTEVFINAFPEVDYNSPEWGPLDVMPDAPDFHITRRPGYAESLPDYRKPVPASQGGGSHCGPLGP